MKEIIEKLDEIIKLLDHQDNILSCLLAIQGMDDIDPDFIKELYLRGKKDAPKNNIKK